MAASGGAEVEFRLPGWVRQSVEGPLGHVWYRAIDGFDAYLIAADFYRWEWKVVDPRSRRNLARGWVHTARQAESAAMTAARSAGAGSEE
jgi:hypothetical protein